jgi:endonuclease III
MQTAYTHVHMLARRLLYMNSLEHTHMRTHVLCKVYIQTYTHMHTCAVQQGHGREICGVLDGLIDYVLERRNFTYKRPMYLPDTCVIALFCTRESCACVFVQNMLCVIVQDSVHDRAKHSVRDRAKHSVHDCA